MNDLDVDNTLLSTSTSLVDFFRKVKSFSFILVILVAKKSIYFNSFSVQEAKVDIDVDGR